MELEEIERLAKPLVDYLSSLDIPYPRLVITRDKIELINIETFIPINREK